MTVEQHDIVDFVSTDAVGDVILTISDHLAWGKVNEHLFCLQGKLNAYLRFIESGEIAEKYPQAVGRSLVIRVVQKYAAPIDAEWFFKKASARIAAAGFRLVTELFAID